MKRIQAFFIQANDNPNPSYNNSALKLTDLTVDGWDYMFANKFIEFKNLQALRTVNREMNQMPR